MPAHSRLSSYEEAVVAHRWDVPERYNIAQDVCDKHPPEKLAMVWEDYRGHLREVGWGELQDASNRLASVFRAHGVEVGDRVAMLLTPRPETAAAFLGTFKAGAILLSLSVLYGDDGIRHRVTDSQAKILVTNAENVDRVRALSPHIGARAELHGRNLTIWRARVASDSFEPVEVQPDGGRRMTYDAWRRGLRP